MKSLSCVQTVIYHVKIKFCQDRATKKLFVSYLLDKIMHLFFTMGRSKYLLSAQYHFFIFLHLTIYFKKIWQKKDNMVYALKYQFSLQVMIPFFASVIWEFGSKSREIYPSWWFSLFSSLVHLRMYSNCKEKSDVNHVGTFKA